MIETKISTKNVRDYIGSVSKIVKTLNLNEVLLKLKNPDDTK